MPNPEKTELGGNRMPIEGKISSMRSLAGTVIKLKTVVSALAVMALLVITAAPAVAGNKSSEWNRLNPGGSQATSGHERLTCREADQSWSCDYDIVPESGFTWGPDTGTFTGANVTRHWTCPEWFGEVCAHVVAVYAGIAVFHHPVDHPSIFRQEYVVTNINGEAILFVHFVDFGFACPWFRTFAEALAANPTYDFDCLTP
jgi:hypothetical protein